MIHHRRSGPYKGRRWDPIGRTRVRHVKGGYEVYEIPQTPKSFIEKYPIRKEAMKSSQHYNERHKNKSSDRPLLYY